MFVGKFPIAPRLGTGLSVPSPRQNPLAPILGLRLLRPIGAALPPGFPLQSLLQIGSERKLFMYDVMIGFSLL